MKTKHIACFLAGIAVLLTACDPKAPDSSNTPQTSATAPTDTTDRTTAASNPTGTTQTSTQPTEDHSRTSAQTTGSSKTRPSSDTSYVDADGNQIYINRAVTEAFVGRRMVNSKPVTKDEFLRQFSVDFPDVIDESINLQYHLEYRVDSQGHSILSELESGFISYRNAANNRNVFVHVSEDTYILTKSWGFGSAVPSNSKINSKDVRVVEYNGRYGGQYKTGQLYCTFEITGRSEAEAVSAIKKLVK